MPTTNGSAVSPGVHAIALTRVKAHLIDEQPATLIDAGFAGSGARIERGLADAGRSIAEVARVICTHGHPDHAGGARELAERGLEILIHPADAEAMRTGWGDAIRHPSRGRLFAAMTPELPSFTPIEDGDVLPVLGGLAVIHTPGHTPGSVCLYGARDRVLFVGDVLQRRRRDGVVRERPVQRRPPRRQASDETTRLAGRQHGGVQSLPAASRRTRTRPWPSWPGGSATDGRRRGRDARADTDRCRRGRRSPVRPASGPAHPAVVPHARLALPRPRRDRPARSHGARRSGPRAGRSGHPLGRQPSRMGHRPARHRPPRRRRGPARRAPHGGLRPQDRRADRRQDGRCHPADRGIGETARPADRLPRDAARSGAPGRPTASRRDRCDHACRDRVHQRHHRRAEGRDADPRKPRRRARRR